MGRYTLMVDNKPVEGYTKVNLKAIDDFTTTCDTANEIIEKLHLKGIHIRSLQIYYRYKNNSRSLDIAYKDHDALTKVEVDEKRKLKGNLFRQYVYSCLREVNRNHEFYQLLMEYPSLSMKVKEYIQQCYIEFSEFNYNKLLEYLSSYTQFRYLVFAVEEYKISKLPENERMEYLNRHFLEENPFEDGSTESTASPSSEEEYIDENDKRYKYDLENFTDEEIEEYERYLEGLPETEVEYTRGI